MQPSPWLQTPTVMCGRETWEQHAPLSRYWAEEMDSCNQDDRVV